MIGWVVAMQASIDLASIELASVDLTSAEEASVGRAFVGQASVAEPSTGSSSVACSASAWGSDPGSLVTSSYLDPGPGFGSDPAGTTGAIATAAGVEAGASVVVVESGFEVLAILEEVSAAEASPRTDYLEVGCGGAKVLGSSMATVVAAERGPCSCWGRQPFLD